MSNGCHDLKANVTTKFLVEHQSIVIEVRKKSIVIETLMLSDGLISILLVL
jgi:hypothetical protein